jgi:hypothetical protein
MSARNLLERLNISETYGSPGLVTVRVLHFVVVAIYILSSYHLLYIMLFKVNSYHLPGMKYLHNTKYELDSKWKTHLRMEVQ